MGQHWKRNKESDRRRSPEKSVVGESVTSANHGFTGAEHIIGDTDSGREVVVVLRVEAAGTTVLADLHEVLRRVQYAEKVILLANHPIVVPT